MNLLFNQIAQTLKKNDNLAMTDTQIETHGQEKLRLWNLIVTTTNISPALGEEPSYFNTPMQLQVNTQLLASYTS